MKTLNLIAYSKTGFEQNIGDSFTAIALQKYLKRKTDSWQLGYFNLKKYDLNKYDLVILGGGGIYHPDHLKTLEKNTNLFSSTTPLAIIGIGLNLEGQQQFKDKDIKRLINLNKRAFINTVRDDWSFNYLKSLGINSQITGCPSLFLPELYQLKTKPIYDLGLNFAISHTGYYQQKSQSTLKFINRVAKKLKGKKIIICHSKKEKKLYQKIFPNIRVFYSNKPQSVLSIYRNCQLVLGMRGHSQIFALATNTSSLAIPLNEKVAQPVKMTSQSSDKLIISLNESLASVEKKINYVFKNQFKIKKQQRRLKNQLKNNFLKTIKQIHQRFN